MVIMLSVIGFVTANTLIIEARADRLIDRISAIDPYSATAGEEAQDAYSLFREWELYMSLTLSHNDLTNIEDSFVELLGYLSVDDGDQALVIKNRLLNSFEHLRRLSGFNFDSVI